MKTEISTHDLNPSSKGMLISAYVHGSKSFILLDNDKIYVLDAEDDEEREYVTSFINQLQVGGYVFVYHTYRNKILKVFDLLSQMAVEAEKSDKGASEERPFMGKIRYITRELILPAYYAFMFKVDGVDEACLHTVLVNTGSQDDLLRKMMRLQAGHAVTVWTTDKGVVTVIRDHSIGLDIHF